MRAVALAKAAPGFVALLIYFLYQLVLANIQVLKLLFVPNERIYPAIVEVPLDLPSDFSIYVLSSMITLTPGTLSLEVSSDRKRLWVHVIHTDSPQASVDEILTGFHHKVQTVFGKLRVAADGAARKGSV